MSSDPDEISEHQNSSKDANSDSCHPPARNCFRLVVLGSSKVGKTAIVSRFLNNKFDDSYTPTIEDFHRKLYRIRGEVYQLDILDTSGNHPFPAMRRLSFLTGDLFVLVYSVDSRQSFEEVIRLREQIIETKMSASTNNVVGKKKVIAPKIPMVIVGNKSDKDIRTVSTDEVRTVVTNLDSCAFAETSAKKNLHIDDLFAELFALANLPSEMTPNLHKKISSNIQGLASSNHSKKKKGISIRRRLSDACGMVTPNVRRPSIRTDLMIMRSKTAQQTVSRESASRESRCVLQ